MQKLVYKNPNGVEIDLTSGNYGVIKWDGFSSVDLEIQSQQVPFQDGSVYLDSLLGERDLSVTVAVNDNNDLGKRYELEREMIIALNPKLGEGELIYTNDFLSKKITCVPHLPQFDTKNMNNSGTRKAKVDFTASNPYWEDLEETEIVLTGGNQKIINYDGDYKVEPEIILMGNSTNPDIKNIKNNTSISINGSVTNSLINLAYGEKTFNKQNLGFLLNAENRVMAMENNEFQIIIGSATITKTKDLKNFKVVKIASNENFFCGCYGKNYFVIGGTNLSKSIDGEVWENIPNPLGTVQACYYDNDAEIFYFGIASKLYSTNDLSTFSEVSDLGYAINKIIKHNNKIFIVTNNTSISNHGGCFEYYNGVLTDLPTNTKKDLYSIASDGENLVVVGKDGTFLTSADDGATWTADNVSETLRDICYNQYLKQFIICGDNGVAGYGALNNIVWTVTDEKNARFCMLSKLFGCVEILGDSISEFQNNTFKLLINTPDNMLCCAYFKNKYIIGGIAGAIYISDNLVDWENINIGISHNIIIAECNEKCLYLLTQEGDIIYTEDGINFVKKSSIPTRYVLNSVAYFNGKYYGTSSDNSGGIYKSTNGESWEVSTELYNTFSGTCLGVVNGKLYFYKSNNHLLETLDGNTWADYDLNETLISDINLMVYYDNKYICFDSHSYRLYTTTDFQNFTRIYSDESILGGVWVANNQLYFSTIENIDDETVIKLYTGDLINKTFIKEYRNSIISGITYYNNRYIINLYSFIDETRTSEETEDFLTYISNNYIVNIQHDKEYHSIYDGDDITVLCSNEIIWQGTDSENFVVCYDILIYGVYDDWLVKNAITLEVVTSPIHEINMKYWDNNFLYIGENTTVYKINKLEVQKFIELNNEASGIAGFENKLYIIDKLTDSKRSIQIYDKQNGEYIDTIMSGNYQASDLTNGIQNIQNGIAIASNAKIIWFEKSQDNSINRICVHDLMTGVQNQTDKTNAVYEVYDVIYVNGVFYVIGYGGIMYSVQGYDWDFINNANFVFRYFMRNKFYYFVGLFHYLGHLEYILGDNIIDKVDNFSLCLETGFNQLVLNYDEGEMLAVLKFHKKYLGV